MRGSSAARPWAAPIYLLAGTSPMHPPTEPRLPLCRPCDEAVTTHATPRLHPPGPNQKKTGASFVDDCGTLLRITLAQHRCYPCRTSGPSVLRG